MTMMEVAFNAYTRKNSSRLQATRIYLGMNTLCHVLSMAITIMLEQFQ